MHTLCILRRDDKTRTPQPQKIDAFHRHRNWTKIKATMKHLLIPIALVALTLTSCNKEKYAANNAAGEAWLNARRGTASASVSGAWESVSDNWGSIRFIQNGSSISGAIGSYSVKGVMNGNRAYLLLTSNGWIYYTAILSRSGNALVGFYSPSVPFSTSDQAAMNLKRVNL